MELFSGPFWLVNHPRHKYTTNTHHICYQLIITIAILLNPMVTTKLNPVMKNANDKIDVNCSKSKLQWVSLPKKKKKKKATMNHKGSAYKWWSRIRTSDILFTGPQS